MTNHYTTSTRRVYLRTRVCVSHIILHTHTNGLSLGHTHDRCYLLHGQPPRTAHLAQSSDHSACSSSVLGSSSTPQGVILTPSEYEEYLRLTQAAKSPPLLLLPRPVMSLLVLHIHLHLGSLILEPLIISLVIKTFFLLLPFRLLYPPVSFTHYYLS